MKKSIIIGLLLLMSIPSFSQSKSVQALQQKYKSNPDFFHLDMGGSILNFAKNLGVNLDDGDLESLNNSMDRFKFLKLPSNSLDVQAEFRSISKSLKNEKFDMLMEASEKKSSFIVYAKGSKRIQDVVILVKDGSSDLIVVEFQGDFDPRTLADIGKNIK